MNVIVLLSVIATAFVAPVLDKVTAPWKSFAAEVSVIGAAPAVTFAVPATTSGPVWVIAPLLLVATSAPFTLP